MKEKLLETATTLQKRLKNENSSLTALVYRVNDTIGIAKIGENVRPELELELQEVQLTDETKGYLPIGQTWKPIKAQFENDYVYKTAFLVTSDNIYDLENAEFSQDVQQLTFLRAKLLSNI